MREEDLELARRWLLQPHVRQWWSDELAETDYPERTLTRWRRAIRREVPTRRYIIKLDGRPIGQIQSYLVQDYPDYETEVGALGERALSIDLFIGEAELVGKGHGPALIRAFLRDEMPRYDVELCVIGPATANRAAVRAYEKAGFRFVRAYREEDTRFPDHTLLALRRRDLD